MCSPVDDSVIREIGLRIRAARVTAGYSQEEAAARASIDDKRWQRLEGGSVNPTVRTRVCVATALEISFWTLLAPEDARKRK